MDIYILLSLLFNEQNFSSIELLNFIFIDHLIKN